MELEWGNPAHMSAVAQAGVFDFVVCNDVLYCADDVSHDMRLKPREPEADYLTRDPLNRGANPSRQWRCDAQK
eukprot:907739-Rhodomonas_salina.2